MDAELLVHVQDHGGHPLERARVGKWADVDRPAADEPLGELERALRESGAGRLAAFTYATLPLVLTQGVAYALYRLEMNIRMAAMLGFVGAGGLGQALYFHLSLFQQAQAATVLIAMFALVLLVDSVSAHVRRGLAPAYA